MMTGEKITATEAEKWGMIYRVFSDETFWESTIKLGQDLYIMPTHALGLIKSLLNQSMTNDLHTQLALEEKYQIEAGHTADYKEGVAAFMEKRKPTFLGK